MEKNYQKFSEFSLHIYLECDSSREFHAAKYFDADFKILTFGSNIIDIQICSWTIMNGMRGILCRINGDLIANFSPLSGSILIGQLAVRPRAVIIMSPPP